MKEYRIVGTYGMWGEILSNEEDALDDLNYCIEKHKDTFHIEERDVSEWRALS